METLSNHSGKTIACTGTAKIDRICRVNAERRFQLWYLVYLSSAKHADISEKQEARDRQTSSR